MTNEWHVMTWTNESSMVMTAAQGGNIEPSLLSAAARAKTHVASSFVVPSGPNSFSIVTNADMHRLQNATENATSWMSIDGTTYERTDVFHSREYTLQHPSLTLSSGADAWLEGSLLLCMIVTSLSILASG